MNKNETIKATLKATRAKRKNQTCKVYEIKLDKSHLNNATKTHLNRLFIEAKWFYNHILAQHKIFGMDDNVHQVPVKVKDIFEIRDLQCLSAQMRQSILSRTQDNIRGLAERKKKGYKIGKLKYKSLIQSIPLKQYGNTYKILNTKYIRVQGIKQKLKVIGLKQIPVDSDIANGTLIHKNGDYYLSITTYQEKGKTKQVHANKSVGIDFGLNRQLMLSRTGIAIQYSIPISPKLRRIARTLSKQKLHSKNWNKTRIKLNKEYDKTTNIKEDIKNKVVSFLKNNYETVCVQDESLKAWQRIWGRKILSTSIGGIISTLKKKVHTLIEVPKNFPSTKTCSKCGNIQEIALDERVYICKNKNCNNILDRDHNSADNMENEGLKQVGTVRTELTPVEIEANTSMFLRYLNNIPYIRASSVYESGSSRLLAGE
ncbi:MAG: transposase [Candidatus Methanoperedens sp.]|nr:zinc ribbon domain-containing protein [Candidatus Methanoperedens sp. BLZ2]MBZ0174184.1 transposase [Candidatus Methanoperedens nitroreducens]MCX9077704.1 transposase [Candidatus Methanoperedens sp.]